MQTDRVEYLLLLDGMDDAVLWSACQVALRLVARDMAMAETDIPWSMRTTWSSEVVDAATRLCDRFVPERKRNDYYVQTGVRSVADPSVRDDFITLAPHAYDAGFWRGDRAEVASLSDEGPSFAIWLTADQRKTIVEFIGAERVVRMAEWNRAHPSMWRRWMDRLKSAHG